MWSPCRPGVHHGGREFGGACCHDLTWWLDRYLAEVADLVARAADDPAALIEIGHCYDILAR
ncbi:MAG: hypothetical protein R2734_01295 [Nocardioides sp.]